MKTLSANVFFEIFKKEKPILIDVRSPDEFRACHVPDSINVPLDKIEQNIENEIPREGTVYLLCQSGMRSERARKLLESRGYTHLICIEGGIAQCTKMPGMVTTFSRHLPLMRQVQLAAGFLVTLGILLAWLVHPAFIGLSLFVGLGLMLAGATGFCGMAMLLEKMPWNHFKKKEYLCSS